MNESPALLVWLLLLRLTALLVLAWTIHFLLRHRHARWRLILWRTVLALGFMLPLLQLLPRPVFEIPVPGFLANGMGLALPGPLETSILPIDEGPPAVDLPPLRATETSHATKAPSRFDPSSPYLLWPAALAGLWALGGLAGALRLTRLHGQLSRIRREAQLPSPGLQHLARKIGSELGVRVEIALRVSDAVTSPFVCGVTQPTILLPRVLVEELSRREMMTLLRHEIAHVRQRDLPWCIGWRWFATLCWFHPLVWRIPAAHNLACENEADRIAADRCRSRATYARLLARLALRVLALPPVETQLTLNAASQLARRLEHLQREGTGAWKSFHSLAGVALAAGLFLPAGCSLALIRSAYPSPSGPAISPVAPPTTPVNQNQDGAARETRVPRTQSTRAENQAATAGQSSQRPERKAPASGTELLDEFQRSSAPGPNLIAAGVRLVSGKALFRSLAVNGNHATLSITLPERPDQAAVIAGELLDALRGDESLAALGYSAIHLTDLERGLDRAVQAEFSLRRSDPAPGRAPAAGDATIPAEGKAAKVSVVLTLEALAKAKDASVPGQFSDVEGRLIQEPYLAENLFTFYRLEEATGVRLPELRQLAGQPFTLGISLVPYPMRVSGTISQVLQFMAGLETGRMIVRFRDYSLTFAEPGKAKP